MLAKRALSLNMILWGLLGLCLFVESTKGSPALVIYAESDLFEYPPYNYTQAFEQFAGLPAGTTLFILP
jgi:hypothetical protein